jgi:sec-independent protein translocase protein TatA
MPFGISLPELLILLVVLLLVFGAKRLPEMGKSLGKGMREFKDAVTGLDDSDETTPSAQAELPPADSSPTYSDAAYENKPDPIQARNDLASLNDEDRKAIMESPGEKSESSATESERETVS